MLLKHSEEQGEKMQFYSVFLSLIQELILFPYQNLNSKTQDPINHKNRVKLE